jgi:hypothetical protein
MWIHDPLPLQTVGNLLWQYIFYWWICSTNENLDNIYSMNEFTIQIIIL